MKVCCKWWQFATKENHNKNYKFAKIIAAYFKNFLQNVSSILFPVKLLI